MEIPEIFLTKYNAPVPRYTSYPPANYFSDKYNQDDYINALIDSNKQTPQNISIYVHIPFCNKLCFYCGCNSSPMPEKDLVKSYIQALKTEIKMVVRHIDKSRKLSQIHYGGGTPNAIPVEYIKEINEIIFSEFSTIDSPEIAIECNPAYLDRNFAKSLNEAGFNRFSLGVQDFNTSVLKTVNREIPVRPIGETMSYLREDNPDAVINLDFIYGLPGQSVESFIKTIEEAVALKPERLVTFSYAHVPWVNKAQVALEKAGLPDSYEKVKMFTNSYELLKEKGYHPIGLDHYVLAKDELYKAFESHKLHRNFQGYCTRETTGQVYAFGVSSISQLANNYFQNAKSIGKYISTVNEGIIPTEKGYKLNNNEIIVREVINELMCNKKIDFKTISKNLNISTEELKSNLTFDEEALEHFVQDGIISMNDESIQVTETGVLFIRNVAASLDPLFKNQTIAYSKSV